MIINLHGKEQLINNNNFLNIAISGLELDQNKKYKFCKNQAFIWFENTNLSPGLWLLTSNMVARKPQNVYQTIALLSNSSYALSKTKDCGNPIWLNLEWNDTSSIKFQLTRNNQAAF